MGCALHNADADRGAVACHRIRGQNSLRHQAIERVGQSHIASRDRRGPCPAIGLNDIAIHDDLPFAKCLEIHDAAKRAPNQAANFF